MKGALASIIYYLSITKILQFHRSRAHQIDTLRTNFGLIRGFQAQGATCFEFFKLQNPRIPIHKISLLTCARCSKNFRLHRFPFREIFLSLSFKSSLVNLGFFGFLPTCGAFPFCSRRLCHRLVALRSLLSTICKNPTSA